MIDCIVIPYKSFKERIRVQEQLKREMFRKFGKYGYRISILDGCIMAEYKSEKVYF